MLNKLPSRACPPLLNSRASWPRMFLFRLMGVYLGVAMALMGHAATAKTSTVSANEQVIKKLYAAFQRGDVEAITTLMDDNVEWIVPGPPEIAFAGTFNGKEGIRRFFSIAVEGLEVREQKINGFLAVGARVGVLGYEHMLVKSTGREYRTDWVHLYTLRHGKIIKFEEFVDTAAQAAAYAH
jgi:uncharacterized protein